MHKWKIIFSGFLFFSAVLVQAQEKKMSNDRIGIEFGTGGFFGEMVVPDRIRASKSEYDDFYCGIPAGDQIAETVYGGIKYEYLLYSNRLGLTAGLRFSKISAELRPEWYNSYFLWLFRKEGLNTDYLRLQNIKQKNYYLGVPLEIRYIVKKRDSFFKQYFKLGASVNYLLSSQNSIEFHDSAMKQYTSAVGEQIEKPDLLNVFIYPAYGFIFGREKNVCVSLEFHFPGFLAGNKAHPFIRQYVGMGMQLSVQIPVNKIIK